MSHGRDQTTKVDSKDEIILNLHDDIRPNKLPSYPTQRELSVAKFQPLFIFLRMLVRRFCLIWTRRTYPLLSGFAWFSTCARILWDSASTLSPSMPPCLPPCLPPYLQPHIPPYLPPCLRVDPLAMGRVNHHLCPCPTIHLCGLVVP